MAKPRKPRPVMSDMGPPTAEAQALTSDTPLTIDEPPPQEDYGLSAETMLSWLSEMVMIPKWRLQADEDNDFFEVNQLKPEVADAMRKRGQASAPLSYVTAAVNNILGAEAQNRTGVRVDTAPGETTPEVAEALTVKMQHYIAESDTDEAVAEAYHGQIVAGVDWVEVTRDPDPFKPSVKTAYVPYHEMWWDWRSKDFVLLSDARYIVRKKRYDWDVILGRWPEVAPIIQSLGRGNRYQTWDYPMFGIQMTRDSAVDRGLREEEFEWFNTTRRTSLVYEVWYRQQTQVRVFWDDDGKPVEYDPDNEVHAEAYLRGLIDPVFVNTMKMRVAHWVGNIRVADEPTPYPHNEFPYVPFFGFREKRYGTPFGMVRLMRGPQEYINNVVSKVHFHMASNQVLYDPRAFDDPNKIKDQVNQANFFIPVKADPITGNLYKVEIHRGSQLLDPHINYLRQLISMFHDVSCVPPAMMGSQGAEMSAAAVGTANDRAITGLAKINDNYRRSRRRVHELLLALVKEDLGWKRNMPVEVFQDLGGPKTVILNKEVVDPQTGETVIENDVSKVNVHVVLENTPHSETYLQQQMIGVAEVLKSSPDYVQAKIWPAFMRMNAAVPGHDRIADMLAQEAGMLDADGKPQDPRLASLQKQVQELEAKLAAKHPQELVEAQIAKLNAEALGIEATVKKTMAEVFEKQVEAFFGAINTAKAIAENPAIAPVADIVAEKSGYQPPSPAGVDPNLQAPATPIAPAVPQPGQGPLTERTHPTELQPPAGGVANIQPPELPEASEPVTIRGAGKGIEGGQQST